MKAVAAGYEIALQGMLARSLRPIGAVAEHGMRAIEVVHAHSLRVVDRREPRRLARLHQVSGDFGLSVDGHVPAASQALQVDTVATALKQHVKAAVHQALAVHARAHARFVEQVHRHLFQHAGADAAQYVVGALTLDDHGGDSRLVQQLS